MSATKDLTKAVGAVTVVTGAASALSGVVDSIGSSLKGIGAAIDTLFTSPPVGLFDAPFTLPIPNPLNSYSSYDYIIGMTCLSADEFNFPDTSYIAGKISGPWLFKGASSAPNNRVKLDGGMNEFYCTELNIKGQYGFEKGTGNTNSTNLEFTIVEPYSMGQFMMAVQVAARNKGYKNYNEAPFLLTIEFRGQDQNGSFKAVPLTKKFIPFNFNNMTVKVSGSGSVYQCVGLPVNASTLMDTVRLLKSDATIRGKTVQEILQSGPNSLQAYLNSKTQQQKKEGLVNVPDEYVILFPEDISSSGANGVSQASSSSQAKEDDTTAVLDTAQTATDGKVLQKLNLSRSSVNKTLVQPDGVCNDIGKAGLGYDITRPQNKSFNEEKNIYDDDGNIKRSAVTATPVGLVDFTFAINTDIVNVINQVLIKSDIAKAALERPPDTNGMRPWWRIDTQVYHITNDANMSKTGSIPKLFVYRVVPYQVHASRLLAPNAPAPGIEQLKKQAAKEYNYIYTGKNVDVIKFEIDISNTFYQVFQADDFTTSGDIANADQMGGGESGAPGTEENPSKPKMPQGGTPELGTLATMTKTVATLFSTDNKGGSVGETQASRVARMFHQAMTEGMDMMNITMDIVGDPYYIANSGAGNFTATQTNLINITKDGNINYQNGEVDIVINFRTPNDLDQATGLYTIKNTKLATQFSGLYKITTINSSFRNGKFVQTLYCNRRQGQGFTSAASPASLISSKAVNPTVQTFDDGSSIQTFDDGSTLVTDSDGGITSTQATG